MVEPHVMRESGVMHADDTAVLQRLSLLDRFLPFPI
jgi:hypothetical protein